MTEQEKIIGKVFDKSVEALGLMTKKLSESIEKDKLSKREQMAMHILTGLCVMAIPGRHNEVSQQIIELVPNSVKLADALLSELSNESEL